MENFRDNLMIFMRTICLEKVLLHFTHSADCLYLLRIANTIDITL